MYMSGFKQTVLDIISSIPEGKVMSYGQVAAAAGSPRAARQVGGVLRGLSADSPVPWWRVINNQGILSIKGNWIATKQMQKDLLEKENVKVSEAFTLDIEKYRYRKD